MTGLWEDEFYLLYYIKGMTPDRIHKMKYIERKWWAERLTKQLKDEERAIKGKV